MVHTDVVHRRVLRDAESLYQKLCEEKEAYRSAVLLLEDVSGAERTVGRLALSDAARAEVELALSEHLLSALALAEEKREAIRVLEVELEDTAWCVLC